MASAEAPRGGEGRDILTPLETLWAIAQCYAVVAGACGGSLVVVFLCTVVASFHDWHLHWHSNCTCHENT